MGRLDVRSLISASIVCAVLIQAPASAGAAEEIDQPGIFSASHTEISYLAHPDIDNFEHVSHYLFRGAAPSENGMKQLADDGVKTVIDLRMSKSGPEKESELAQRFGLKYFRIPMGYGAPALDKVRQFLKIVTNPQLQPVFVHCRYGADRTGTLVGVYRRLVDGWTYRQTYAEMRQHHFKPWLLTLKRTVQAIRSPAEVAELKSDEKDRSSL